MEASKEVVEIYRCLAAPLSECPRVEAPPTPFSVVDSAVDSARLLQQEESTTTPKRKTQDLLDTPKSGTGGVLASAKQQNQGVPVGSH